MNFEFDYLKQLAELLYENDLCEISLADGQKVISLRREKPLNQQTAPSAMFSPVTSQVISASEPSALLSGKPNHKGTPVTSPMAGTFYGAPSPDDAPFVNIGDNVSVGQVICIIEAMKLMNEIEADVSGKITEICVNNGDNIEFGQILMYVD